MQPTLTERARCVNSVAAGQPLFSGGMAELTPKTENALELDDLGDRLESFYMLRKTDSAEADAVLDELGATSDVDRDIIVELASKRPLGHPDRFWEAHTMAVRSLEVLDRNGTRSMPGPRWMGPAKPLAKYLVGIMTGFIVKSHLRSVIDNMRRLYIRRESAAQPDDPSRPMITEARIHAERLTEGFKRNPLGVPGFVLGGAFLSAVSGAVAELLRGALSSTIGVIITLAVLAALLGGLTWVIVKGSAIAHRRIALTTKRPLRALWQTVGRCGDPPGDKSATFAFLALLLMAMLFVVIPLIVVPFVV